MTRSVFHLSSAARGLVVGRVRGEGIEALRVQETASAQARILAGATLPWDSGRALGDPLERLLGWQPEEPVILAVETPDFAGGAVTLRWPSAAVAHARTSLPELSHQATWQARELVRDQAAKVLQCGLEDLALLTEDHGEWQENVKEEALEITTTILFRLATSFSSPPWSPPPDVPQCHFIILPVLFGELLTPGSATEGLLIVEEDHLSFITRRESLLTHASSIPLGTSVICEHLQRQLACSPREAVYLLERMNQGDLSPESARLVARLLRDLLPLFRAAVSLFSDYTSPLGEIASVWVAGLWPVLMQRFFFGSHALFPQGSARPGSSGGEPARPIVSQVLPSGNLPRAHGVSLALRITDAPLLEHLAISIFRRSRMTVAREAALGATSGVS